ncbi:hypothetical protein B296_00056693 [Ensete ventricosum]|uniref:Uncharacterized protein n=1 Tax=Ensete ventricosum TaxID=4639 RepID=A0A426XND8_ENSVE|nr:hypothetical protein B296_00056693 [Ensete ventricosum]
MSKRWAARTPCAALMDVKPPWNPYLVAPFIDTELVSCVTLLLTWAADGTSVSVAGLPAAHLHAAAFLEVKKKKKKKKKQAKEEGEGDDKRRNDFETNLRSIIIMCCS